MRVVLLGGTRFIGRAIVEELHSSGHELVIVHRGQLEPDDLPHVAHVHCYRTQLPHHSAEFQDFNPDAVVDCRALTHVDAELALAAFPTVTRWMVISSVDVYRAFGALLEDRETDPVPLDEESPVRMERYPYRGKMPERDDYDKLDVEDVYGAVRATVLRLPMVYGEHDYQLREEFILRRVRAGRLRIPFGSGTWLTCRVYVRDMARAARMALESAAAVGQVLNVCEDRTYSMRMWSQMILQAAGSPAELVRVADELLPEDLKPTGSMPQHIATSAKKAHAMLGWSTSDPIETLRTTVRWHLDHPPAQPDTEFAADDRALASV